MRCSTIVALCLLAVFSALPRVAIAAAGGAGSAILLEGMTYEIVISQLVAFLC